MPKERKPPRSTCRFHCSGCGSHFSSLEAFDAHRQGTFQPSARHCVAPEDVANDDGVRMLVPRTQDGFCDLGRVELNGVEVWTVARNMRKDQSRLPSYQREGASAPVPNP